MKWPQFINVLRGEMTLVGPRAYREEELREYAKKYPKKPENIFRIFRAVKPGITGLWQTSGRNDLSFETKSSTGLPSISEPGQCGRSY